MHQTLLGLRYRKFKTNSVLQIHFFIFTVSHSVGGSLFSATKHKCLSRTNEIIITPNMEMVTVIGQTKEECPPPRGKLITVKKQT